MPGLIKYLFLGVVLFLGIVLCGDRLALAYDYDDDGCDGVLEKVNCSIKSGVGGPNADVFLASVRKKEDQMGTDFDCVIVYLANDDDDIGPLKTWETDRLGGGAQLASFRIPSDLYYKYFGGLFCSAFGRAVD